jgi:DNA-binding MarR family transcriptional regulator
MDARRKHTEPDGSDETTRGVVDAFRSVFTTVKTRCQDGQEKTGLASTQVWAMSVIDRAEGMGVGELAAALSLHQSTASNLLRPLLNDGLVEAQKSEEDRRAVRLALTPAGRRLLRKASAPFTGVIADALGKLDEPTLKRLEKDLSKLAVVLAT